MTPDPENRIETTRSPEATDRLYLGVCGGVWLLALAASAVATVALVNLGRGHDGGSGGSTRALYAVIAVSALTIIVAIPLLLKARRAALDAQQAGERPAEPTARHAAPRAEPRAEKMRVFGSDVDLAEHRRPEPTAAAAAAAAVERVVLRGSASLLTVMGGALTVVAVATSLLARHWTIASLVSLGLAALVLGAVPVVLIAFLRQLPTRD